MPNTDHEDNLVSILKDYWTYQKHYFLCFFDLADISDIFRDRAINNSQYVGNLCLQVTKAFCTASEEDWEKVLKRHGFNGEFYTKDMSLHLNLIMSALRDVDRNKYWDPNMLQAIDMANDPQYAEIIRSRKKQISRQEAPRSVLCF